MSAEKDEDKAAGYSGADIEALVARALAGDYVSLADMYGIAGAGIGAGLALPEPLRTALATRLRAIHDALRTKPAKGDYRDVVLSAVVPVRKVGRPSASGITQREYIVMSCAIATENVGDIIKRIEAIAEMAGKELGEKVTETEARRAIKKLNDRGIGKGQAWKTRRIKSP